MTAVRSEVEELRDKISKLEVNKNAAFKSINLIVPPGIWTLKALVKWQNIPFVCQQLHNYSIYNITITIEALCNVLKVTLNWNSILTVFMLRFKTLVLESMFHNLWIKRFISSCFKAVDETLLKKSILLIKNVWTEEAQILDNFLLMMANNINKF